MKLQVITGLLCLLAMAAIGQETKTDSVDKKKESVTLIKIGKGKSETGSKDSTRSHPNFSIQLTLSRIDLGLAKFTDNGSFTLSAPNQFLETDTWKSNNVGFEFFQMGYRFTHHFKVYVGAGIDWTHMRLKQDVTIKPGSATLDTIERNIDFKKNRFSSTYLRIPLSVQVRTNDDRKGNKIYLVFGPEIGFLINGKVKQVSNQEGKEKVKDDFNLNPFRYGAFGRLGYDDFGLYVKYYNSDVFADDQGPQGFKNLNFGIMVGF